MRSFTDRFAIAVLCLGALGYFSASSAAVIYDESISGDRTADSTQVPLVLGSGSSEIIASFTYTPSLYDADSWVFTVPVGLQLNSWSVSYSRDQTVDVVNAGWSLYQGILGSGAVQLPGSEGIISYNPSLGPAGSPSPDTWFETLLPLQAGTYSLMSAGNGRGAAGGLVPYSFTLQTAPVPLPAAAWLLLSGIGGLAAMRKRRLA
jgi:hypothetical protein